MFLKSKLFEKRKTKRRHDVFEYHKFSLLDSFIYILLTFFSSSHVSFLSCFCQIFCRAITFAINAFILRNVEHDVLGIMNVRLLLLESTLLFLSKESISRAALSSTTQHQNKCSWAQLINQMWITVPMASILSLPCLYVWLNVLSPVKDSYQDAYHFGCYAMVLSCIFELTAEAPAFIGQVFCFVKLKVILDTLHIFVRSSVFIILVLNNKNTAIYAFGIAQFMSCLVIIGGNYGFFHIYIKRLKTYREVLKKHDNDLDKARNEMGHYYEHMNDFPFNSIIDMIPGKLENPVSRSAIKFLIIDNEIFFVHREACSILISID